MKENLKSKRGITLIALIITIIILLILAMVTINILINQGIIGHANNAVRGYEVAEEKELISLAYQNYKMDQQNPNVEAQLIVDGANGGNPIPKEEEIWTIKFDKTGHEYELQENGTIEKAPLGWKQRGDTITLGDVELKVGDYINYDHTTDEQGKKLNTTYTSFSMKNADPSKNNGRTSGCDANQIFKIGSYTNGWRVLRATNGKLELISAKSVREEKATVEGSTTYSYYLKRRKST